MKNIECFSRALRLRWEWFRWDEVDRPWKGTPTPCDSSDKQLFSSCTTIQLGDGSLASFWMDRWLNGVAPAVLASEIFKLTRLKRLSVKEAMDNGRWMKGLQRMHTDAQIEQFVRLWGEVQNVMLSNNRDSISWDLTANAAYSACSAYEIQFAARIAMPGLDRVWRCKMEGKVKFYLWLLLQNRNWTADHLRARGWSHNSMCRLCDQQEETAEHLTLSCCYAKEVWFQFSRTSSAMYNAISSTPSIREWWFRLYSATGEKEKVSEDITLAAYIAWNLWMERNRRVFDQKERTAISLAVFIKEEVNLFWEATKRTTVV